jgi:hypothetical protein
MEIVLYDRKLEVTEVLWERGSAKVLDDQLPEEER